MKRSIKICLLSALSLQVSAQKDVKAKEVLDAVAANYEKSTGTEIIFGGTMDGSIILKGEKFVLDCGGIKSWFDGKTLWSYVEENEEVNVSSPTNDELLAINPYMMLGMYRNGTACKEVVMTPEKNQDVKRIVADVNSKMEPVYICIEGYNGEKQEIEIRKYLPKKTDDSMFVFDKAKYPKVEIIDLR